MFFSAISAYAMFKHQVIPNGGPAIAEIFTGFPAWFPDAISFTGVARDYFDILFLLLTCFVFMVNWEFQQNVALRIVNGLIAIGFSLGMWAAGSGHQWIQADRLIVWQNWHWNLPEFLCLGAVIAFAATWIPASGHFRVHFSPWKRAITSGFYRWLAGLCLFTALILLVFAHPFYLNSYYQNWRITCGYLYLAYVYLGLPYAVVTCLLRGHKFEDRSDPNFNLLLLARSAYRNLRGRQTRLRYNQRRVGVSMRDLLVKLFFVPLMVTFLFFECGSVFNNLPRLLQAIEQGDAFTTRFNYFYQYSYHSLFVMDVGIALLGYVSSSRWLDNKSKSVDPTLLGWMTALICYPPFNNVSGGYLPYDGMAGTAMMTLFGSPLLDICLKSIILLSFTVYVWSTLVFGLRFSNLTNRGIITTGPYAVIRHPAYLTKNIAWWLENLSRFVSPWQFVFLAVWNYIYYLRAVTEERHLMMDPDYRLYCKRVKYRFIPGLF